jgi:hypothetical protein
MAESPEIVCNLLDQSGHGLFTGSHELALLPDVGVREATEESGIDFLAGLAASCPWGFIADHRRRNP